MLVTGWNTARLDQRLTELRATMHRLADNPLVTATAAVRRVAALPASAATPETTENILGESHVLLRRWVHARAGICAPSPPAVAPADTATAIRVRAAASCEQVINDLIDRHMRVAEHAVSLFGSLRQRMNDGRAQNTAVRRAGITFHLSGGSIAQDSAPLMRAAGGAGRGSEAWPTRPVTGRAGPMVGRGGGRRGSSLPRPAPPEPPVPRRRPTGVARAGRPSPLPGRAATPDPLSVADFVLGGLMELGSDQHPDPFRDAIQEMVYRAVQVGSFAVTGIQVYAYHRRAQTRLAAERDHQARRALNAQIRAERDADKARWQPALDPGWLRRASLIETAQAWGAALPYTDRAVPWYEPAAATALARCEERLRSLHPYAMAWYDRLVSEGQAAWGGDAAGRPAVRPPSSGPGRVFRAAPAAGGPGSRVWRRAGC